MAEQKAGDWRWGKRCLGDQNLSVSHFYGLLVPKLASVKLAIRIVDQKLQLQNSEPTWDEKTLCGFNWGMMKLRQGHKEI